MNRAMQKLAEAVEQIGSVVGPDRRDREPEQPSGLNATIEAAGRARRGAGLPSSPRR